MQQLQKICNILKPHDMQHTVVTAFGIKIFSSSTFRKYPIIYPGIWGARNTLFRHKTNKPLYSNQHSVYCQYRVFNINTPYFNAGYFVFMLYPPKFNMKVPQVLKHVRRIKIVGYVLTVRYNAR